MELWTKYYYAVKEHPKTKSLAALLSIRRAEACGLLANLWSWAVKIGIGPDGDISAFRETRIEKECAWEGETGAFIEALFACGWLDGSFSDDSASIHDWEEYGGALAVERARAAERKQKQRVSRGQSRGQSQGQSQGQSRGQSRGQSQGIDVDVDRDIESDIESESEREKEKEQHRQSQTSTVNSQVSYRSIAWSKWRKKAWEESSDEPGSGNPEKLQEYFSMLYPGKEKPIIKTIERWLQSLSEKALLWIIDQAAESEKPVAYAAECVKDKVFHKLFTYKAIMEAEK